MNMMNKCAKFHKDSPSGKKVKFNLARAIELSETAVFVYKQLGLLEPWFVITHTTQEDTVFISDGTVTVVNVQFCDQTFRGTPSSSVKARKECLFWLSLTMRESLSFLAFTDDEGVPRNVWSQNWTLTTVTVPSLIKTVSSCVVQIVCVITNQGSSNPNCLNFLKDAYKVYQGVLPTYCFCVQFCIETLCKRATSVAHLTNFSFEFFYEIFTEDASLRLLYHGAKKVKNDQKPKSRGESCLKSLNFGVCFAFDTFALWSWLARDCIEHSFRGQCSNSLLLFVYRCYSVYTLCGRWWTFLGLLSSMVFLSWSRWA